MVDLELPTVYNVEATEEILDALDLIEETLTEEQQLQTADGSTVTDSVYDEIEAALDDDEDTATISKGAVQHLFWAIETVSRELQTNETVLETTWELLKEAELKEWTDEEEEEFQEAMLSGVN